MILEQAIIAVKAGQAADFEAAYAKAKELPKAIPGFRSMEIRRCIEVKDRYLLLAVWDKVEDHTEGFRNSPAFQEWRALLGPYFDGLPQVQHFETPF